jgi:hypothetical protein
LKPSSRCTRKVSRGRPPGCHRPGFAKGGCFAVAFAAKDGGWRGAEGQTLAGAQSSLWRHLTRLSELKVPFSERLEMLFGLVRTLPSNQWNRTSKPCSSLILFPAELGGGPLVDTPTCHLFADFKSYLAAYLGVHAYGICKGSK